MIPKKNDKIAIFSMSSISNIPKKNYLYYIGKDIIWKNTQLEIIYDGKSCYIYSLGEF